MRGPPTLFSGESLRVGVVPRDGPSPSRAEAEEACDALVRRVAADAAAARPASFASDGRVLVYGADARDHATLAAQCPGMPREGSRAAGGPRPPAAGVHWASRRRELAAVPAGAFDAVLFVGAVVGAAPRTSRGAGTLALLRRALADGGVLAGVACLAGEGQFPRFRQRVEACGLRTQVSADLALEGRVVAVGGVAAGDLPGHFLRFLFSAASAPVSSGLARAADPLGRVVVTGRSVGLPNLLRPDRAVFDPENFDRIFAGENFISQLTDADKRRILDQNVVQVLKVDGKRVRRRLERPEEVIQLASRVGRFDLVAEYGVPPYVVAAMDSTYQLGIAAGLEALRSAGIRLGAADGELKLPPALREETGVIFASSFPCADSTVEEVTLAVRSRTEREVLALLRAAGHIRGEDEGGPAPRHEAHEFDRKLLFKMLVMANNQLAELVGARGPNTHVNSACSSTSQAVAMAEDWIRCGRCRRVVVIGADNSTSDGLLPYVGTGFLALTAASTAPDVASAALPFDARRNGMILGCGAAGLVVESLPAARERGAVIRSELVASHFCNSAFHASLLDRAHIASELAAFVRRLGRDFGLDRHALAADLLYMSHETFTCANGGCAAAEMDALEQAFSAPSKEKIIVCNTKGFTAHPMGVGFEDAVAVACLERGLVPPLANHREADPRLGRVHLSPGGQHARRFALRFSAGFGSQFVFLLFRKWDEDDERPAGAETAEAETALAALRNEGRRREEEEEEAAAAETAASCAAAVVVSVLEDAQRGVWRHLTPGRESEDDEEGEDEDDDEEEEEEEEEGRQEDATAQCTQDRTVEGVRRRGAPRPSSVRVFDAAEKLSARPGEPSPRGARGRVDMDVRDSCAVM